MSARHKLCPHPLPPTPSSKTHFWYEWLQERTAFVQGRIGRYRQGREGQRRYRWTDAKVWEWKTEFY